MDATISEILPCFTINNVESYCCWSSMKLIIKHSSKFPEPKTFLDGEHSTPEDYLIAYKRRYVNVFDY